MVLLILTLPISFPLGVVITALILLAVGAVAAVPMAIIIVLAAVGGLTLFGFFGGIAWLIYSNFDWITRRLGL